MLCLLVKRCVKFFYDLFGGKFLGALFCSHNVNSFYKLHFYVLLTVRVDIFFTLIPNIVVEVVE
jgi:hypothetical protein